jgi:hypothetical protein
MGVERDRFDATTTERAWFLATAPRTCGISSDSDNDPGGMSGRLPRHAHVATTLTSLRACHRVATRRTDGSSPTRTVGMRRNATRLIKATAASVTADPRPAISPRRTWTDISAPTIRATTSPSPSNATIQSTGRHDLARS